NSICVKMSALRFFYRTTLRRPAIAGQIPMPRRLDHLPTVLAREEVEQLLKAVADLKLRTALITIYSAGLRISEAIRLTARDVDIRVIQDLLGHRHIKSTVGYARVAINMIRQVQSPLELLNMAATALD